MQEKIAQWYELCGQLEYDNYRHWKQGQPLRDLKSEENLKLNEQLAKLSDEICQEMARRGISFDRLQEFSRGPMYVLDFEHDLAMLEIERLEVYLRAEVPVHPLGIRLNGSRLTRGDKSVELVGKQLGFVREVLQQPGIHKKRLLKALYTNDDCATIQGLDGLQTPVNEKLKPLKVRIQVVARRSGELDFVSLD